MKHKELPNYSKGEEIFNFVTHVVGGGFGVIIFLICIITSIINKYPFLEFISLFIYSLGVIILYTTSSIYHLLRKNKAKKVFRILDHCTIYLLIAGTYTPICVFGLKNSIWGVILLLIVWVLGIIGITLNAINMHSKYVKTTSMILYILTGWCALIAFKPIIENIGLAGFIWILIGGILYTIGTLFYAFGKKKKYIHSIWHIFVLLGTIAQFIAIFFYVVI